MPGIKQYSLVLSLTLVACGGGDDGGDTPTDVDYGVTSIIAVVNPTVNDITDEPPAQPGSLVDGVDVWIDGGPLTTTNGAGQAVLSPVDAGNPLVHLDADASVELEIAARDLHELAIAYRAGEADLLADIWIPFDDQVIEVTPSTPIAEVNAALQTSGQVVFFAGGTYTGDIEFDGSDITLFGAGAFGGRVVIDGNVTVTGSRNRIRGAHITGNLDLDASDAALTFSRVDGDLTVTGSDTTLLQVDLCGSATVSASGPTALDVRGMAPLASPDDC